MPLMVVFVVLLILMAAIPIDGGFSLVLVRQTQNGADAAAQAAASALTGPCTNTGTVDPRSIRDIITSVLAADTTGAEASATEWKAQYIAQNGIRIPGTEFDPGHLVSPGVGSCGITISVNTARSNIIGQLFGLGSISTSANAAAIVNTTGGVQALAQWGRHTFHAKGVGDLTVDGNLYDDSQGCAWVGVYAALMQPDANRSFAYAGETDSTGYHDACSQVVSGRTLSCGTCVAAYNPPPGQASLPFWGEDTIDTFDFSPQDHTNLQSFLGATQLRALNVTGSMYSPTTWPLDPSFYGPGQVLQTISSPQNGAEGQHCMSSPPFTCLYEDIYYNGGPSKSPNTNDPLANMPAPDPANPQTYCSTGGPAGTLVDPAPQVIGGVLTYFPGTYTKPIVIGYDPATHTYGGTDIQLAGCGSPPNVYPGIYVFQQGVEICPGLDSSGNRIKVTNADPSGVMLYSEGPFGGRGPSGTAVEGCPGEGKATPFFDKTWPGDAMQFCPGFNPPPRECYENTDQVLDAGYYGSGTYGITIGGHGTVNLTAPTSGPYRGIVLFQDRAQQDLHNPDSASPIAQGVDVNDSYGANIGLDPYPGERATPRDYHPDCVQSVPGPCSGLSYYHDNFHASLSAGAWNSADNASINLTGAVYDAYAPLTGAGAPQLAKLACWRGADYSRIPDKDSSIPSTNAPAQCFLNSSGAINQPTPGASLPAAALYDNSGNPNPVFPASCGSIADLAHQALCQHQLDKANLWRVLCSSGTPATHAGRIQIGQSTCSNDPQEMQTYANKTCIASNTCGDVTITGAAIADVFTTSGGVTAVIDVQNTNRVDLIAADPPS